MTANREFKFACPVCQQHLQAELDAVGKIISCPTCCRSLIVPAPLTGHLARVLVRAKEANEPRTSSAKTAAAADPSRVHVGMAAAVTGLLIVTTASVLLYTVMR